ncbi:MAG: TonB-dependent receptor [Gammaproteobacteria bacterium]|nr:TonB-dependent receptor [Gammaproteobacteria bacterium]
MSHRFISRSAGSAMLCAAIAAASAQAVAQAPQTQPASRSLIDEVVVTAQRRESTLQDTAVAVSAFDQSALDRENINTVSDMQLSVPNLSFTKDNFTGSNVRIRGIGNNAVAASSDSGTAINFNGAYLQTTSIFESELFDVERVEVLRGPQGTLYGRNTTGGVINIIPAKADPTQFDAAIDLEAGNFDTRKASGMVNIPLGEQAAVRLSGRWLERDGYVENTFLGEDIDDRDLWSTRVAFNYAPTDRTEINFFWQRFREDSTRMRTSNQLCAKDPNPFPFSLGCLPGVALDDPDSLGVLNSGGQLGGILASSFLPPGVDAFANSTRSNDLRQVQTPLTPVYEMDEDLFNLEIVHEFDNYTLTLGATYQEIELNTITDYAWAVPSATFLPNVAPVPLPGFGFTDAEGRLQTPSDPTVSGFDRPFAYDTSAFENEALTIEARIASSWDDKPFDFLAGFFYLQSDNTTIYDVRGNTLAAFTPLGEVDVDGREAPLAYFRNDTADYELETWAIFGEFYVDLGDRTRLTLGLRYSDESKDVRDRQTLLNNPGLPFVEGVSNRAFLDNTFEAAFEPGGAAGLAVVDERFYGFGTSGNNPVPNFREFGDSWSELTGRVAIDHYMDLSFTDETMVYGSLSRSYKSGGINPPSFSGAFEETFNPEFINAIEIGAKNRLLDGRMQANITYFWYDYDGLQNTKIIDRTSVNENIDARIQGLEFEMTYVPVDNLRIDAFVSWLDTKITGGTSIDPANPTDGNPNFVTVKNGGADVFIVPTSVLAGGTFDATQCGQNRLECANIFTENPAASGLGAQTPTTLVPIGIANDLKGNQLPGATEWSVKLGAQYSFMFGNGLELVPRLDYYWQDSFYYRVYNSAQDKIPSWSVWNASLTLYGNHGNDGTWYAQAFMKNIGDKDHITGAYFTDASSGNFTNIFLLEPRTYGLQIGARF